MSPLTLRTAGLLLALGLLLAAGGLLLRPAGQDPESHAAGRGQAASPELSGAPGSAQKHHPDCPKPEMLDGAPPGAGSACPPAGDAEALAKARREAVAQLLDSARMWERQGRPELARQALEKILRAAPGHPRASLLLGDLELRSGNVEQARALAEALEAHAPDSPAASDLQARINAYTRDRMALATVRRLREVGDYETAAQRMREIYPEGPPPGPLGIEYWTTLALTEHGFDGARAGLERFAARYPGDPAYPLALADILIRRDRTRPQAFRLLADLARRDAVRADPDLRQRIAETWRNGLDYLADAPRNAPAFRAYLRAFPGDSEIAPRLAAIDAEIRARQRRLQDPVYRLVLAAEAALDQGDLETARPLIREALAQRPEDPDALGALGALRMWEGRHEAAHELFAQARARARDRAEAERWAQAMARARFWMLLDQATARLEAGAFDAALALVDEALSQQPGRQPGQPDARALRASVLAARGDTAAAESAYRAVLADQPDHRRSVNGLLDLLLAPGTAAVVDQALALLNAQPDADLAAEGRRSIASALREQADLAEARGKGGVALRKLERAVAIAPGYPWARHDLARRYAALGLPGEARQLMREGVAESGEDVEMRHAQALVLSALGDDAAAMEILGAIPFPQRSAGMQSTLRRLQVGDARRRAEQAAAAGDRRLAEHWMQRAEGFADNNAERMPEVARGWIDVGRPKRARELLAEAEAARASDADLALAWAEVLEALEDETALRAALTRLDGRALTTAQQDRLAALERRSLMRFAEARIARGDAAGAALLLAEARQRWPQARELIVAHAEALQAAGAGDEAVASLRRAVGHDAAPSLRLALIGLLAGQGRRDEGLAVAERLAANSDPADVDAQVDLLRAWLRLDAPERAEAVAGRLAEDHPGAPEVALAEGLLLRARDRNNRAMAAFRRARAQELAEARSGYSSAQANIDSLEAARDPLITAGLSGFSKPGRSGVSEFNAVSLPIELRLPWRYQGDFVAMVGLMRIGAGRLDPEPDDAGRLGSIQPQGPAFLDSLGNGLRRQHEAVDLGLAWEGARLRADIGVSAFGFPVTNILGGLRWSGALADLDYQIGFARRPMTGTVLSYAGVRDPASGRTWGGVTRTGFEGRVSRRRGRLAMAASAGAYRVDGRRVVDNEELRARFSADWRLWQRAGQQLDVGAAVMLWHFTENLEEFTLGHGGYFSPQGYVALSLPVDWRGRRGRWSWRLGGSVSVSYSDSEAQDFFPGDPALQAAAGDQPLPSGFDEPVYDGDAGPGFSFSLRGALERAVTDDWYAGGDFDLTRAEFFTPSFLRLYLRRDFGGKRGVRQPPQTPQRYADY